MAKKLKKGGSRFPTPPPPIADDDQEDLMNDLLSQLEARDGDQSVQQEAANVLTGMDLNDQADQLESGSKTSAKDRFKARQARKAAALAETYSPDNPAQQEQLEREAQQELKDITRICKELDVQIHEVNPDGHCLFSAVADQLHLLGLLPASQNAYTVTRAAAAEYMFSHPDDFLPFLPASDDMTTTGIMTPEQFETYCSTVRDTAYWGGEPEILALCCAFGVPIHVIQGGKPPVVVHEPSNRSSSPHNHVIRISYHRRMYGLGEHYNSLRPARQTQGFPVPHRFSIA